MPRGQSAAPAPRSHEPPAIGRAQPPTPQSAPELPRFALVQRDIAAGGQPTLERLRWLKEHGYRTVLNLLPKTEADPAEASMVQELGLAYLSLPVTAESLDADALAEFNQIMNDPENRPLFIHDSTGSRTGALWYLHRIQMDQAQHETARREATQIGLHDSDTELWLAIQQLLARGR